MARRRNKSFLDELYETLILAPVWVGPILAVLAYLLFRLLIPKLLPDGSGPLAKSFGATLGMFSVTAAPYVGGLVLLVWGAAEMKKLLNRRVFDRNSDIDGVRGLSWAQFESYIGEAFRRQGYAVEETGSTAGDGGVDLVIRKDGQTGLVQCKQWKAWQVGVKPVRELLGVVTSNRASFGVLVTSGRFSRDACDFARDNPIRLIDGEELAQLIGGTRIGPESAPAPGAATDEVQSASAPTCPVCRSRMVMRTAGRGARAGSRFWGCSTYPRCRGTRELEQPSRMTGSTRQVTQ